MNTQKENFTLSKLFTAVPFFCALLITALPNNAEAGVCGRLGAKANCVDSKDVKNNSLASIDILDNSLSSVDILDNNLTTADILDSSLTGVDVQDDSLSAADLNDEAGADFVEGTSSIALTGAVQIITSLQVTAPKAGVIIANASGWFNMNAAATFVQCGLSLNGTLPSTPQIAQDHPADPTVDEDDNAFALTRGFAVSAGTTTVNLVCIGTNTASVEDTAMTTIYTPTRY